MILALRQVKGSDDFKTQSLPCRPARFSPPEQAPSGPDRLKAVYGHAGDRIGAGLKRRIGPEASLRMALYLWLPCQTGGRGRRAGIGASAPALSRHTGCWRLRLANGFRPPLVRAGSAGAVHPEGALAAGASRIGRLAANALAVDCRDRSDCGFTASAASTPSFTALAFHALSWLLHFGLPVLAVPESVFSIPNFLFARRAKRALAVFSRRHAIGHGFQRGRGLLSPLAA